MTNSITDLTQQGLLRITGDGAKKLLQGQLTCNLDEISSAQSRLAAHCNPQGRVISLFRLFLFRENYYLSMPIELIGIAMAALKKYAVFFKVQIDDVSREFSQLGVMSDDVFDFPNVIDEQQTLDDRIIIKLSGNVSHYLMIGEPDAIHAAKSQLNFGTNSIDEWKARDIQSDLPAIYPETSEKFLPHELNLPALNAVSFTKGCYTGQEIIARMHYRGKLKTQLMHAKVNTTQTIQRGSDIYCAGKAAGSIVDYAKTGYTGYELLILTHANNSVDMLTLDSEANIILE